MEHAEGSKLGVPQVQGAVVSKRKATHTGRMEIILQTPHYRLIVLAQERYMVEYRESRAWKPLTVVDHTPIPSMHDAMFEIVNAIRGKVNGIN